MASEWTAKLLGLVAAVSVCGAVLVFALSLPAVLWLALTVALKRQWVPLVYNLRSLRRRSAATVATFAGLALAVFVLTTMLMMGFGIEQTMATAGAPANVKVMFQNSPAEAVSHLTSEQVRALTIMPEVRHAPNGDPLVSPELVTLVWAQHSGATDPDDGANVVVRGLMPVGFELHRLDHIEGRIFKPGLNELVIGQALAGRFAGAALGGTMQFGGYEWKIVGIADHGGSAQDSEIWGDLLYLQNTLKRPCASVTVALKDASLFPSFVKNVRADPKLTTLKLEPEREYWKSLSRRHVHFVTLLGIVVATIFSFGVISGAMNTMYAQVAARTRELGTLRTIGYRPRAILISVVFESVLLAFAAGVLGVCGASLMQWVKFQSSMVETLSDITFRFMLSPAIVAAAIGFACFMGYAGSLLPALKAARMPLVRAIRGE